MKILCLTPWFPKNAQDKSGKFVLDSLKALRNQGHEIVTLVTFPWHPTRWRHHIDWMQKEAHNERKSPPDHLSINQLDCFRVHCCPYLSIPRNYGRSISNVLYRKKITHAIHRLAKIHRFHLIHAHTELAGLAAVDAGKQLQLPTVMTLHGIDTDTKLYTHHQHYAYEDALKSIDKILMVGHPLLSHFKQWIPDGKPLEILSNGFWPHETIPVQQTILSNKTMRLISVSNLQEGKGIDITLRALAKLNQRGFKDWSYTIVGEGSSRKKWAALTSSLDLQKQVYFLGAYSPQQVSQILSQADIFVLPSKPEAFGIAYLEAMATGLLTIGVAGEGPSAFIKQGRTGLLIEQNNAEHLYDLLQMIFKSHRQMQAIANEGKKYVNNYFTWDNHARTLTTIYQKLIKNSFNTQV